MASKDRRRETQTVTREDVGEAPTPGNGTSLVATTPPDELVAPANPAQAFLDEVKGPVEQVRNLPIISINHREAGFVLPTGELVYEVSGYPIYHFPTRRFYKKPPQPGQRGQPPDCWSADMVVPHDTSMEKQAATCAACKMAEFGTARDGRSQACAEHNWVFLLNPSFGDPPVMAMSFPPSSIRVMLGSRFDSGYLSQARARHGAHQIVWTTFGLQQMGEQVPYCVLVPRMGPPAEGPRQVELAKFRNNFRAAMDTLRLKTPDVEATGDEV